MEDRLQKWLRTSRKLDRNWEDKNWIDRTFIELEHAFQQAGEKSLGIRKTWAKWERKDTRKKGEHSERDIALEELLHAWYQEPTKDLSDLGKTYSESRRQVRREYNKKQLKDIKERRKTWKTQK